MSEFKNKPPTNKSRLVFAFALLLIPALLLWIYLIPQPAGEPSFESIEREQEVAEKTPLEQMEEMWKTAPGHGPIALELANMYYTAGKYDKALEFYREFLKNDTTADGWLVHLDVSRCLVSMDRAAEAVTELTAVLKDHPGDAGTLYNLGAIEANRGNHDAARNSWNELIRLHPQDTLSIYAQNSLPKLKPANHP